MYREDTLEGVIEFCEWEGQPCESVKRLVAVLAEGPDRIYVEHGDVQRTEPAVPSLADGVYARVAQPERPPPPTARPGMTPVWCECCRWWVVEEFEPHRRDPSDTWHHARDCEGKHADPS